MKSEIKLFEERKVRTIWNEDTEEWYFSIIDVIGILTESPDPKRYWSVLKTRIKKESNEGTTICSTLKLLAADGKMRMTDVANETQLFRLIQSIPSPKAEPFKQWMAQVAKQRLDQIQDPELSIEQAMRDYRRLGYSEEWINTRLQSIQFRKELTDQWKKSGVEEGLEYAILTNLMTKEWSGKTVAEYKKFKRLKKENLRDNMTGIELALNILAEASATEISKTKNPKGFNQSQGVALEGAKVAKDARRNIESRTGKSTISQLNAKELPGRKDNTKQIEE
jgi:prophage antirepressor-like protein